MHSKDVDNISSLHQQYMGTHLQPLYKSSDEIQPVSILNLRQNLQITDQQFTLTQHKREA